jgi:hypothetical protein
MEWRKSMTGTKRIFAGLMLSLLLAALPATVLAEQGGAESITLTLDRAVMPVTIYHAGLLWTEPQIVTVQDFVIRDYLGNPIQSFVVQKASAREEIPIETVESIRQTGWINKNTKDIKGIEYVVPVVISLTDGRELETLMNADFGTIEGFTILGSFFLDDPHTVKELVFNRP